MPKRLAQNQEILKCCGEWATAKDAVLDDMGPSGWMFGPLVCKKCNMVYDINATPMDELLKGHDEDFDT